MSTFYSYSEDKYNLPVCMQKKFKKLYTHALKKMHETLSKMARHQDGQQSTTASCFLSYLADIN